MRQYNIIFGLLFVAVATITACGSDKSDPSSTTPAGNAAPSTVTCEKATIADLTAAGFASSPNACSGQMYAKYADAGFQAVNNNIAKLALAAPESDLGSSFQTKIAAATPERQQQFTSDLLLFLETAYGRSDVTYQGPAMIPAHASLGITIAQYKYFITDVVVPALTTAGVDPNDINNCFAPVVLDGNFVSTVVTCK